ncbi:MAG: PEP-CTERM sorting domain-containing protein [Akkermansia sp.]
MKKSIIALMALAGMASASSPYLYYRGGANGYDLLTIENGYAPYLIQNGNSAPQSVVTTLTTEDSSKYEFYFDPSRDSNVATPSFALNQAIYLGRLVAMGSTLSSFTIDFGTAGSITTYYQIDFGSSVTSIKLSASLTTEQLSTLAAAPGNVVTRTLMTGKNAYGICHFGEENISKIFSINNLEGYEYKGLVASDEDLQAGEFGYIYTNTGNGPDYVQLVVKGLGTPEPTTATLSLLALAGLAARRRRQA